MISQTSVDQLVLSLKRLRSALSELTLVTSDFQFDHDTASRQLAAQQTDRILNAIRLEKP
jgi:hypothetical protein